MVRKIQFKDKLNAEKSGISILLVVLLGLASGLVVLASYLAYWICSLPFSYCSWLHG